MTEFSPTSVRFGFAALYLLAAGVLAAMMVRVPKRLRGYSSLLLSVVVVSAAVILLQEAGIGQVEVGAGEVDIVDSLRSIFVYIVVYGGVTALAGASRRLVAAVVGLALTPILTAGLAPAFGAGTFAPLIIIALLVPYPVLLYVFFRPVWRAAAETAPRRRLLHWKARNIIIFSYTMSLLLVFIAVGGLVADEALVTFLFEYAFFLFQAGIPGFLLYKFAGMDEADARTVAGDLTGAAG